MDTRELIAWLGERLDKIEGKVDGVSAHCAKIDVTLTGQAKDIAHHIARTDALEARVEQVAGDVKPLQDQWARLRGIAWFVGVCVAVLGALATMKSLLN